MGNNSMPSAPIPKSLAQKAVVCEICGGLGKERDKVLSVNEL
jgi:hypothetical protein